MTATTTRPASVAHWAFRDGCDDAWRPCDAIAASRAKAMGFDVRQFAELSPVAAPIATTEPVAGEDKLLVEYRALIDQLYEHLTTRPDDHVDRRRMLWLIDAIQ